MSNEKKKSITKNQQNSMEKLENPKKTIQAI